jgi:branched-chain amino acid transport system substrate-binding protein
MTIARRKLLRGIAATGIGLASMKMPAVIAQTTPLRVGLLTVKTGPLAQGGLQMLQGISLFLKEKNNVLAGRNIELLVADTGGSPAGTKTKAIELVERDKAEIILGPLAAFEVLAITNYISEMEIPLITLAAAEDVTQRQANPWFVRTSASSAQTPHAMADYCAKELKMKQMATLANDFAFGHEQCAGFQKVFEDAGGKIVSKLWPPLTTPDYVPFAASIKDVDGVFSGLGGSNPLKFLKTYQELGLKDKVPLTGGWTLMDDTLLKAMGDEAIGTYSANWYTPDYNSSSNQQFVAGMQKEYGELPGGYAAGMYLAGQVMEVALQKTGGKTSDKKALMSAIRSASLRETPRGPFHFDDFGNAVGSVFIRRCERKDGRLVNTTLKTYDNISQFWSYDQKAFLAEPVYNRDYPPAKNLRR